MYTEEIHIGKTTKISEVVRTIEFEEEDLIREGMGPKFHNGELDLYRKNYYIGEWLVDLWGRDKAGTLISESSFGGFNEAEWEGESTLDILRFWKLTKVEMKEKRGHTYYVIYSGKRHWDIDEELYQREKDFLPVLFSLVTDPAHDVEFEADGVYYIANGFNTVAVYRPETVKYKGCLDIPSSVTFHNKKYTVTEIRNMGYCEDLTEVKLPDTIIKIADSAFHPDDHLRKINFPDSLEIIEEGAFWGCTSLESVVLPKNCCVCKFAFAFCESLKDLVMSEERSLSEGAFRNCISLESVELPQTTRSLDPRVFENCKNLKEVILNDGLKSLYCSSFSGTAIKELRIPKSLSAVYDNVYTNTFMGFTVDSENEEFNSIDGVLYSEGMERLEICPMGFKGEMIIPEGVKYIEGHAFYGCRQITKVVIPDSVEYICWGSFERCTSLQTVIIGNGVKQIDKDAFSGCESLSNIIFGENVERIDEHAFEDCKSITKIQLPLNLRTYSVTMFEGCRNLSELTMPEWMEKRRKDIMEYATGKKHTPWF